MVEGIGNDDLVITIYRYPGLGVEQARTAVHAAKADAFVFYKNFVGDDFTNIEIDELLDRQYIGRKTAAFVANGRCNCECCHLYSSN